MSAVSPYLTLTLQQHQARIRQIFAAGGVFAYPTEAVYGLGGNPYSDAWQTIVALKGRDKGKGMILVAADWQQVAALIDISLSRLQPLIAPWQDGRATTFVLPASRSAPRFICDAECGNIAVRVSTHAVVSALCRLCAGALLSTSANPSGQPPATTVAQVSAYFPEIPVLAGAIGQQPRPSRIVNVLTNTVLRD